MSFNKREVFILFIGFLCLFAGFCFDANPTVKEIYLFGAEQIIDGKTPYKDFQTIYAPAIFYFNALILSVFSNSLFAINIVYLFIAFFISLTIYGLARDYLSSAKALFPFFISIIAQVFFPMYGSSVPLGVLLILFAAFFLFRYYDGMKLQNSKLTGIIPLGICIGLLGITRQDMASYMYGLFFWAMFWAGMADVEGLGLSILKRALRGFLQGVFFTVVVFLTFVPFAIYFISVAGLDNLYHQIIEIPLTVFREENTIPFPTPFYFLPIIIAISSAIIIFIKHRKKLIRANTPIFWKEILVINLTLNIFNYALIISDLAHLIPAIIFASMLLPNIFNSIKNNFSTR
jgi:hypothetical protein